MRRLNGIDAYMLYSETPMAPNHTLKIGIYDPSKEPGGYSFEWLKKTLAERLHRLPPFRWRVVPTPFGLQHPLFVEDPDFDLERHVFRIGVPAPGGLREMSEMISQILTVPLDRSRPLWEIWVLEGLADDKVAFVGKVHHAIADGVASAELLGQFFTTESDGEIPPDDPPWQPEAIPSWGKRLGMALVDLPKTLLVEVPRNYRAFKQTRKKIAERKQSGAPQQPSPFDRPNTPFNKLLTPHRLFACETFKLADVKAIRAAFGATINDVVLAAVSGALRRYLQEHEALPAQPLVGSMPFSIRTEAERGTYGNRISTGYVALRSDIEDPVERLRACHEASEVTKAHFQATKGAQLANWLEITPPFVTKLVGLFVKLRKGLGGLGGNLIVSNVPGPRQSLYLQQTRLSTWYSIGMVFEGTGLNMTVWSYVDQLNLSIVVCRELVPDVWKLVDYFRAALEELVEAARHQAAA